jgi:hypothetical protein
MILKAYIVVFGMLIGFIVCAAAAIAALFGVPAETCSGVFAGGIFLAILAGLKGSLW